MNNKYVKAKKRQYPLFLKGVHNREQPENNPSPVLAATSCCLDANYKVFS